MGDDGFLAIDAGSGSVKTFLVSPRGVIIRRSEINWDRETWTAETGWAMIARAHGEKTLERYGVQMYDESGHWPVPNWIAGDVLPWINERHPELLKRTRSVLMLRARGNMEQLEEISGAEFEFLKFCGGNSKSDLWMQIQADVLGIPVEIPETRDGTAIGTAILEAVGSGYYGSTGDAVSEMVRFREPVIPNEKKTYRVQETIPELA